MSSILIPEDVEHGLRAEAAVGDTPAGGDVPEDTGVETIGGDDVVADGVVGETGQEPRTLHWECGWQFAVRSGKWKLSWADADAPTANNVRTVEHAPVGDGLFLADLENDLAETTNLADTHPQVVSDLLEKHAKWIDEVGLREDLKSRV